MNYRGDPMQSMQIGRYFDILSQSQRAYSRQLEPVCKKWDLSRSEVDVLLFLYNNPGYDRASDIVSHRGMTKSHVSMSVANLADRHLLIRQFSPADRRTAHLQLTETGMEIAREARESQKDFFRLIHRDIGEEELELWNRISQKICGNIEKMEKTPENP